MQLLALNRFSYDYSTLILKLGCALPFERSEKGEYIRTRSYIFAQAMSILENKAILCASRDMLCQAGVDKSTAAFI